MRLDLGALASALGHGATAGAAGYEQDEERRRRKKLDEIAARRLADQEARQSVLDQANVQHLNAETHKLNEPEKDAYYPVNASTGVYGLNRRTGKTSQLTGSDGQPLLPNLPPRRWVPTTEKEALDFEGRRAELDAKARERHRQPRSGSSAGQVTPAMKQRFLQDRLRYHMTPREDNFGDPVSGTGLDREEAEREAQADVDAAYPGETRQPATQVGSSGGSILRGGGLARAQQPVQQPARPKSPTANNGAGEAALSPQTGTPLRHLNDRERATAQSDSGFAKFLRKKGYRPQDWM